MAAVKEGELSLVPGRSCGNCVVCCYVTNIDTPEIKKSPGILCEHCTGKGCGVYETRFPVCRSFYCGWRYAADLGEDWRPDKSGVIIVPRADLAEGSPFSAGWHFNVFGGEVAIRQVGFVKMIVGLVNRGVVTMLTASGPMGLPCDGMVINELVAETARKNDLPGTLTLLLSIHRQLLDRANERLAAATKQQSELMG